MAATGNSRANANKKIRQEALREQLANGGHVEHVIDIAKKLADLTQALENSDVNRLKAAADIKMRLITKYLPDLKAVEIEVDSDEDTPSVSIAYVVKEPVGDVKTTHGQSKS
jgi:hypothetical protein